jgi:hypothetical protein
MHPLFADGCLCVHKRARLAAVAMDSDDDEDDSCAGDEDDSCDGGDGGRLCETLSAEQAVVAEEFAVKVDGLVPDMAAVREFLGITDQFCRRLRSGRHSVAFEILSRVIAYQRAGVRNEALQSVLNTLIPPGCRPIQEGGGDVSCHESAAALLFLYSAVRGQGGRLLRLVGFLNVHRIEQFSGKGLSAWTVCRLKEPHDSLVDHTSDGMSEPRFIPLIVMMLGQIVNLFGVPSDWRVMFYLKHIIDLDGDMCADTLKSIKTEYSRVPFEVKRVVLVFSVSLGGVGHVMCVLIVRSIDDGHFITVLDDIWNGSKGDSDYRTHYLNLMRQIADCIGMAPFRVAVPSGFEVGAGVERANTIPVWLETALAIKLDIDAYSRALQCAYDAYLFIKIAVIGKTLSTEELEREHRAVLSIIDSVNLLLVGSILSGCAQLSVVSLHIALLRLDAGSSFYIVGPDHNRPANVYGLAVRDFSAVSLLRYEGSSPVVFRWDTRPSHPGVDVATGKRKRADMMQLEERKRADVKQLEDMLLLFKTNDSGAVQSLMTIGDVLGRIVLRL